MIAGYAEYLGIAASIETLRPHALEWATTLVGPGAWRGNLHRNGRG